MKVTRRDFFKYLSVPVGGALFFKSQAFGWAPFAFWQDVKSFSFSATIIADTLNYNIRTAAVAGGWNGVVPLIANITIISGVTVGSSSNGTASFDTGAPFPNGSSLNLVNDGVIMGRGGNGGNGGVLNGTSGALITAGGAGGSGGTGLVAQYELSVTNNGTIAGGGGAGGGGGGYADTYNAWSMGAGGGGGGMGSSSTTAALAGVGAGGTSNWTGSAGTIGTKTAAGVGGNGSTQIANPSFLPTNRGGNGGALGSAGGNGLTAFYNSATGVYDQVYMSVTTADTTAMSHSGTCGLGGAAGSCTVGNTNINWITTGTRSGALN